MCVCVCVRSGKCCKLTINSNCVAHCKAEFWCVCVCVCVVVVFCVFFTLTESTNKGVNQHSKDVIQVKQQRPKLSVVIPTWHASKHKVHNLCQRYIFIKDCSLVADDDEVMLNVLRCQLTY